ncbi:hypothetical protein [Lentzea aerocolonigenes]|uniref:hypothetical protein n=1 Tax=Lentzea aerocolonigenes TaxID=68170 RepID=UPI0004C473DE|nr:hypothetical protein [Lentzea aerocolonigenes]MCP2241325.1 hypothetical protein [Lentzea aerocolonigenes]
MSESGTSNRLGRVVAELKALRKGYGVESRDIAARIGPELRLICGFSGSDSQSVQRAKLVEALTAVVAVLPDHLAAVAATAFGLQDHGERRFEERISRMAAEMERDVRTARRHVDHLMGRIAETLIELAQSDSAEREPEWTWHTADLVTLVVLGEEKAEIIEQRRVVSRTEHLAAVDFSMTIAENQPLDLATLGLDVLRGAILRTPERVGSTRVRFDLDLPRSLGVGEEHTIVIRTRLPTTFAPYYVCTPARPCDRFDLVVRFPPDRAPSRAWRLQDELPIDITDPLFARDPLEVNTAGEVHAVFTGLTLNRSCGIGWEPAAPR